MKAITLRQPMASLIAVGAKKIVTRPEATDYRGSLAIQAAATPVTVKDPYFQQLLLEAGKNPDDLPLGLIIAQCRLVDCREITTANCPCYPEFAFSDFIPGWFAWTLSDIHALSEPVPAKGREDLWEWNP